MIPLAFINFTSEILGDTEAGLSGSQIAKYCSSYSINFDIEIPYPEYPFPKRLPNKRTALRENLKAFSPDQQFKIIKELCELKQFENNSKVKDLKIKLITRYGQFFETDNAKEINEPLIDETKHWLSDYPESLRLYEEALSKLHHNIFKRNLLDDLRLSLEKLLQIIFSNRKSLENQLPEIGSFIKQRNGSKELSNMFVKLIDYYTKYQNTYVKHDDAVIETEIEIIFEITSSFMKFLLRIQ